MNVLEGKPKLTAGRIIAIIHVLFALSFVYFHFWRPFNPHQESIFFMGALLALTFVLKPLTPKAQNWRIPALILDILLVLGAIAASGYLMVEWAAISARAGAPARPMDILMGVVCLVVTLEATRRVMPILVPVALLFLAYAFFGRYIPGYLAPPNVSVSRLTQVLYLSNNGLWGSPLRAGVFYIMPFLIMGALLKAMGVMDIITVVALNFLRGTVGAGAKLAVLGSAFFGMLSGSSVANVTFSGTFSIPMMRRNGFSREFAASVEAGASTAGSLTPPVMGLAAFIMVEFTGISYGRIALAAAIPAIIYYAALFLQVHLKSRQLEAAGKLVAVFEHEGTDQKQHPNRDPAEDVKLDLRYVFAKVLPILLIVVLLVYFIMEFTVSRAAFYMSFVAIGLSLAMGREHWLTPRRIWDSLIEASTGFVSIGPALICSGIMLGVVSVTGVGLKLSEILRDSSGDMQFLLLIIAAINLIILGMGLGGAVVYIIGAIMLAPAMVALGIDLLPAHFFIFYIAQLVTLVPPVCMTIYAAITLAGSHPGKTIVETLRLTAFVFVLPFISVFHDELLFVGDWIGIATASVIAMAAAIFLVLCTNNYVWGPLNYLQRVGFAICSAALLIVGNDDARIALPSLIVGIALLLHQRARYAKAPTERASSQSPEPRQEIL